MKKPIAFAVIAALLFQAPSGSADYRDLTSRFLKQGMSDSYAIRLLTELTGIGPRQTASANAATAVDWAKRRMEKLGLEHVRLEPVQVPHWVRGEREEAYAATRDGLIPLAVTALGGSTATPADGVTAPVIEVRSLEEAKQLGEAVKGKIIFFNGPMDPAFLNTFEAYGKAAEQRTKGPSQVSAAGAIAALVRSMTMVVDDVPHTGATRFEGGVAPIPAAALSTVAANRLSEYLKEEPQLKVTVILSAKTLEDAPSANVVGEIRGSEKPDEIVLIGAHLDSWDKGTGAHDDGAGCAHVLEAARLILALKLKPKRTIRVVLFMNEEFGLNGAKAYAAEERPGEKPIAALETDAGGFTPRGFAMEAKGRPLKKFLQLSKWLQPLGAGAFIAGHAGSDVGELVKKGVPGIGFMPDSQRYFDYHHSDHDTLDKVNARELELGAISIATLAYILAEEGL